MTRRTLFIFLSESLICLLCLTLGSDGAQTAAGDAGEAGVGGGECRVGAPETLRGADGAEAEAGVPEYEGHDGQRVSAENMQTEDFYVSE